jgi:MFS family permease
VASVLHRVPSLRSRDFSLLVLGQLVSMLGTQMQQVGIAWQVWSLKQDSFALGVIGFFRVVPVVVFGLGGGVVADAFDRRRLLILTQASLAFSSGMLALLTWSGHASPGRIYALLAIAGTAAAFDAPTRQSLVPLLVPREHLASALSINTMAFQLASIGGPALGGFMLQRYGLLSLYAFDAASFGAVIAALLVQRHRQTGHATVSVSWSSVVEGLEFLRHQPLLLSTMLLDFFATFFGGSMLLMPIFADKLLKVGPEGLGWLYAAQPAGALLAATALAARPAIRRRGAVVIVSVAIYGVAIAGFGAARQFPLAVFALAVSGAADTVSMVVRNTMRQLLTPDSMRGRMTAVGMIFFRGGPQLGEVEAGAVAKVFDARTSVVSGGLLCVLVALATAWWVPKLRRYVDRPEAQPVRS